MQKLPDTSERAEAGASEPVAIAAFYKFVDIDAPDLVQALVDERARSLDIRGTVLIAREGINATVSGSSAAIEAFIAFLHADARFADMPVKRSAAPVSPFRKLKVRVKPEIVTFGEKATQAAHVTGHRVDPKDWNGLISDPSVIVIDTRNEYEFDVGTFAGARNPHTRSFTEFADYVSRELTDAREKKIAMFCTGGIRCEKASSYLIAEGFKNVFQLDGGILNYLEQVPADASLWQGECFVFDGRVSVDHSIGVGGFGLCAVCGFPVRRETENAISDERPVCATCSKPGAVGSELP